MQRWMDDVSFLFLNFIDSSLFVSSAITFFFSSKVPSFFFFTCLFLLWLSYASVIVFGNWCICMSIQTYYIYNLHDFEFVFILRFLGNGFNNQLVSDAQENVASCEDQSSEEAEDVSSKLFICCDWLTLLSLESHYSRNLIK